MAVRRSAPPAKARSPLQRVRVAIAAAAALALCGSPLAAAHAGVGPVTQSSDSTPPVGVANPPITAVDQLPIETTIAPQTTVVVAAAATTTSMAPPLTMPQSTTSTTGTTLVLVTTPTTGVPSGAPTSVASTTKPEPRSTTTGPTTTTTRPASTPDELRAAVKAALNGSTATASGVEVSVDGLGSVVSINPDLALIPASTQKLYVAAASLATFGKDARFTTEVRASTPLLLGAIAGPLVLRAGGDPALTSTQLKGLADSVSKAGIRRIDGGLLLDGTLFDRSTRLTVWKPSFTPAEVGALDALIVDGNSRATAPFLVDPGLDNLRRFRTYLVARGVKVAAGDARGTAGPSSWSVASASSPVVTDLVATMLKKSNNTYAEVLTKQLGARNGVGTTANGVAAIASFLSKLGAPPPPAQIDGSGLSNLNRSTPRSQVQFLRKVLSGSNAEPFVSALAVACLDGTLKSRMCDTRAASVVRAKTGAIDNVATMTGIAQTASGRRVLFSILLNGTTSSQRARAAIDRALVVICSSTL